MLGSEIQQQIRGIVHAQEGTYSRDLTNSCDKVRHDMSLRGLGTSGPLVTALQQTCEKGLEQRAAFIWKTIERVFKTMNVKWYKDIAADIKAELRAHLNEAAGEANRIFRNKLPPASVIQSAAANITINEHYLLGIYNAEADLFCEGLKAAHSDESGQSVDLKGASQQTSGGSATLTVPDDGEPSKRDAPSSSSPETPTSHEANLTITARASTDSCADIGQDTLGRQPYVEAFADFVSTSNLTGPFTIAITGSWGEGKTIFLKWIDRALEEKGYKTVWFNAWKYETRHSVWASLALAILERHNSLWLQIKLWWFRAKERVSIIWISSILLPIFVLGVMLFCGVPRDSIYNLLPGSAFVFLVIKALWPFFGGSLVEKVRTIRGLDYEKELGFQYQFDLEFRKLIEQLATPNRPLIIFVDDLDRLSPRKTAEVFEAINFLGENENCIFFVGLDVDTVSASLAESYGKHPVEYGFQFSDKFLQLVFSIPAPTKAQMALYAASLIRSPAQDNDVVNIVTEGELSANPDFIDNQERVKDIATKEAFETSANVDYVISQAIEWLPNNPRKIKRFINNFRLTAFIAVRLGYLKSDQANLLPLAALLVARQNYPGLLDIVADQNAHQVLSVLERFLDNRVSDEGHKIIVEEYKLIRYIHDRNRLRSLIPVLFGVNTRYRELMELVR